jgi:NADPH:quinone reductase-like Zn-dependent oxidoreductase
MGAKPSTMQAIRLHAYGTNDGLTLDTVPVPQISADEILVRVHAASVNPVDWKVCDGILKEKLVMRMPFIPGGDFSGTVAAAGSAVSAFQPGSQVFGMTSTPGYRSGAFAEYVAVKAEDAAEKPRCFDHVQAASVPLAALTAWQAVFDRAAIRPGQRVLIHAGAGGVGSFAIQFAREAGAYVIATTSAGNTDYVRALGADQVIDYRAQKFEEVLTDIDVVIDLLGEDVQRRSYAVLRPGGVLVNAWGTIMEERANAAGVRALKVAVEANGGQLTEIAALIDAGKVKTTIAAKIPYADTSAGLALSRTGHVRGKIVLVVRDEA